MSKKTPVQLQREINAVLEVDAANDRRLAPGRDLTSQFYTLASKSIADAGGITALVAHTAMPPDARNRMADAARAFFRRVEKDRNAYRAQEGLEQALRVWNLIPEADALASWIADRVRRG